MSVRSQRHFTVDDYFFVEEGSVVRHEFCDGQIFAVAGGTLAHNQIASNVLRDISSALKGRPCRALGSDMRVMTPGGLVTYPDVVVVCGKPEFALGRRDIVTNPTVLVEVLSDATQDYDRGEKFEFYKAIPSFRDYLVLEQNRIGARLFHRGRAGAWRETAPRRNVTLASRGVRLSVAEIYDKVFED